MSRLQIRLLGTPQVELDGEPVTLTRNKALALCARLAVEGAPLRRDTLATLLWPELSQSRARAGLRRVLTTLTNRLGHTFFAAHRETIGLAPDADIRVDVTTFRDALAPMERRDASAPPDAATLDQMAAALDLYRGDFLAGFSLRDAPDFDNWQYQTTEALRLEAMQALDALVNGYAAQGDVAAAWSAAQRLLALDPLDERAHRHQMRLLAQTGQRAQALRHYEHCAQLLDEELGVTPAPATTELANAIRTGALQPAATDTVAASTARPAPTPVMDEIRSVTVLSMSVIAPTADDTIPTTTTHPMADFITAVRAPIAETGAHVDHLGDDGGLFYFGVPQTFEDDPERALHLALALRQAARQSDLDVAVGVKTGPAILHGVTVNGPVISQAVALQRAAGAGEILVDHNTFQRTRGAFALTSHDRQSFRVLHPLSQTRKARGLRSLRAPMVGRARELAVLRRAFATVPSGQGQALFIRGDAGVGKSRLAAEFKAALEQGQEASGQDTFLWLEGRCLEMSVAAGYWPFRELFRVYFGWQFDESSADFAARIARRLRAVAAAHAWSADQLDEIGAVIGTLLSLNFGNHWDERLAHADAAHLRYRMIAGLGQLLFALAAEKPLVLVLEDLHWADDLSMDLIIHLLDGLADRPVLLLCIHRPAPEHRAGHLAAIAAAKCPGRTHELHLDPLSPSATRSLVELLLEVEALERSTKNWILERAQGNPFFTEEVVRTLIEDGYIAQTDGRWEDTAEAAAESLQLSSISSNVDSLIHARVDRLAPALRQVLQTASVIGRTFPLPVLQRLIPHNPATGQLLWELETHGFLYQERAVPDPEYSFHHVLTQEAVYRMIPLERRTELHHRTAVAMETIYADELDDQVEQLAYHFGRTDDHEKAADYLLRAGRKARRAYLNEEAVRYLRAAHDRLGLIAAQSPAPDVRAQAAAVNDQLGRALYALGRMPEAEQALRDAIAAQRAVGYPAHELAFTYFWLCEVLFWLDKFAEHVAVAQEGLSLLPPHDKSAAAVILTGHVAIGSDMLGDRATYWTLTDWYGDFIVDLPFCEELSPAYHHLIDAALSVKDLPRALALARVLEEKARARQEMVSLSKALYLRGRCLSLGGAQAAAEEPLTEGFQLAIKADESTMNGFIASRLATDAVVMGRPADGRAHAERLRAQVGMPQSTLRPWGEELLGWIYLAEGNTAAARQHLQAALDLWLADSGQLVPETAIWLGCTYLADGDCTQARRCFADVLAHTRVDAPPRPFEPERRSGFAEALTGLEASTDSADFRTTCAALRRRDGDRLGHFTQWHLESALPATLALPATEPDLTTPHAPWRWVDPSADSIVHVDKDLVIAAVDGRDLWYVNETAPRMVRPIHGDCIIEVCCAPADPARPAMGGVLLWHDLRNFVRLDRGARGRDEISFMGCMDGRDVIFGRGRLPGDRIRLRLERMDNSVRALCSADGVSWFTVGTVALPVADEWEAGILALGYVDRALYPGTPAGGGALRFERVTLWQEE